MPLELHPAGDADMQRAAVIERAAFEPLESNAVLFPGPLPPGALDHRVQGLKDKAKEQGVFCFKVIDTDLMGGEEMVAFASWVVHHLSNPALPPSPRQFPPQFNIEACALLFNRLDELEPKHMGARPHVNFSLLFTDPKHRGRGAGTMLLRHAVEHATDLELPIYLNASEDAHGLYQRHRFLDLELMETDFSKWGMQTPVRTWAMLKECENGSGA